MGEFMSEQKCCPDLGFLIVFPSYHAGGIPETGHAAVVVVNGRTGELKGYDFGPDDHSHEQKLGFVREYKATLALSDDCLPDCDKLSKVMRKISDAFGKDKRGDVLLSGNIAGVMYKKPPGSYEKSVAYASDKERINAEYAVLISGGDVPADQVLPDAYHYKIHANNCMTFALSVIEGKKSGKFLRVDWPWHDIADRQFGMDVLLGRLLTINTSTNVFYNVKTGGLRCSGCCKPKEENPGPEQMGGVPVGDGLYYYPFSQDF
jgi:hypothetical protein